MARQREAAPDDGSIEIDLSKPKEDKRSAPPIDYSGKREPPAPLKTLTEPEAEKPIELEQPPEGEDLQSQVAALKAREKKASERAAAAEAAKQQVEQARYQEQLRARNDTDQARYESVVNALSATQAEADALQSQYEDALASNNHKLAADVHRKMVKAETRIATLEEGKGEFERAFEQRRNAPPPPTPTPTSPNIETMLAQMPALTGEERDWLREHPDALIDQRQVMRLQAAYLDAEQKGIKRGSDEYFRFFEDRLGYEPSRPEPPAPPEYDAPQERQPMPQNQRVAAPVSRQAPGASARRTMDSKVVLSPAQREAARIAGADEHDYARNVQKLADMKKRGYYQEVG